MADIAVDITIAQATARAGRTLVYTTDQIGYWFFLDGDGIFGYRKTTDGGATWAAQVDVDGAAAVTTAAFDVWYDRWTPGDNGTLIHCWWFDTTNDIVRWRTLDTNGDTLGTVRTVQAETSAVAGRGCFVSGTKTRSGYLYCAYDIDAGAERELFRSTDSGTSWGSTLSSTFIEATLDTCKLYPASGTGDDNDCWALYYDASATAMTLKLWDSSAASATESSTIQTHTDGATDLTGQFGYDACVRHSDGHLIAAMVSLRDNASSTHQIFDIESTSTITTKTAITTNIDDHYYPNIFIDQFTNDLYVAYVGKRDGSEVMDTTVKVYYTKSTDGGATWSAGDTAYMEAAAAIVLQAWTPLMGGRFCAVWRVAGTASTNKVNSVVLGQTIRGTTIAAGSTLQSAHTVALVDQSVTGTTIAAGSSLQSAHELTYTLTGDHLASGATLQSAHSVASVIEGDTIAAGSSLQSAHTVEVTGGADQGVTGDTLASGAVLNAAHELTYTLTGDTIASGSTLQSAHTVFADQPITGDTLTSGAVLTPGTVAYEIAGATITTTAQLFSGSAAAEITGTTLASEAQLFGGEATYTLTGDTIASTAQLFSGAVTSEQTVTGDTLATGAQLFSGSVSEGGDQAVTGTTIASTVALYPGVASYTLEVVGATIASTVVLRGGWAYIPGADLPIDGATLSGTVVYPGSVSNVIDGVTIASTLVLYEGEVTIDAAELVGAFIGPGSLFPGSVAVVLDDDELVCASALPIDSDLQA